ncbi:succinate--CoA ligase subunit alpha [Meiothermus granaticius]|uniref:Succinate--CoA ligase [ADP-forming] subunit alpha n=1 Tax=Meiothermus granaticius NBRC 107808 TaxID=1227551 RepID=A0A399FBY9_9DEIN|nr:succinate--CoA ligase subunit alpha [Meiothermus granaticius]MCL6525620.1 succinate--CoA ligase subunit alpha [Thermaceae bacterium]RIH93728.1 Succinate--CoA ligase [GDP-forming] subunit alpha [Meiothermus granaticius NBRC 107808]GEM85749.1 succinate--CoA ligase [ADP-forming] subunit alpha [Meiothermus granaticius NBRC 107808]
MSILVDQNTRVLVQGITGREGLFHTEQMLKAGTKVVAGVTPGKGGQTVQGIPVYDTVKEAAAQHGVDASIIFVPAAGAADAALEAAHAGIPLVVLITEGIPTMDMVKAVAEIKALDKVRLIGGNCPGLITPAACKIGIMPASVFKRGRVGLISRSGTVTYETAKALSDAGLGISTCVGIGGDPIIGSTFKDLLPLFNADPETEAVVICGEIGGSDEEDAAAYVKAHMKKPVVGFIGGRSAPKGKKMGHAGAIISGNVGTPESKLAAFAEAGVPVADTIDQIVELVRAKLQAS